MIFEERLSGNAGIEIERFDGKDVRCIGAGEQARRRCLQSLRDALVPARVVELEARTAGTGNKKRLWIDLGGEACKGRVTASERDINTSRKWPGWLLSRATPLVSLQVRE